MGGVGGASGRLVGTLPSSSKCKVPELPDKLQESPESELQINNECFFSINTSQAVLRHGVFLFPISGNPKQMSRLWKLKNADGITMLLVWIRGYWGPGAF